MKELLYKLATDKYKGVLAAIFKLPLLLLSFIYGALIRALILFYSFSPRILACKVISVGNITVGGTGKTSLVELISRLLKENGRSLAVLTRGYKGTYSIMADEPRMLAKNLEGIPVIVDKDRIRAAKRAIREYNVDTVILDDGFQQWRIKKDLEIVTIDAANSFGNRHMLPRGLLREPLASLKRADIFFLTKVDQAKGVGIIKVILSKINPQALTVESKHNPVGFYDINNPEKILKTDYLKGKRVLIFSGIGDPGSFTYLIKNLGISIGLDLRFPDHYNYSAQDLSRIVSRYKKENLDAIVTTEKDASRLPDESLGIFDGCKLLVLRVELKIMKNEGDFIARLLSLYSL